MDQRPASPRAGFTRKRRPGRAALLASAALAGLALAACSVDNAFGPMADVSSVGSITPPAAIAGGSESFSGASRAGPLEAAPVYRPAPVTRSAVAAVRSAGLAPATDDPASAADAAPAAPAVADTRRLAEGVVDQPVVGGIGTDHPVALTPGQDPVPLAADDGALPQPEAATEMYEGPRQLGAPPGPLSLPPGADAGRAAPALDKPVEVAAMPRPVAPEPEPEVAPAPRAPEPERQAPQSSWEQGDAGGGMPADQVACRQELKRLGVTYAELPPIHQGRACGIDHPIKLIALSGGIRIKPAATLDCKVTAEFAKWVKSDLAPAARTRYFSGISSITQLSSYSCRTMNSQRGAPMSEHAHGNAIDVGAITLNSGRRIDVRKPGWFAFRQRGFLNTVRAESCDHFTTVLGPGTNKYHWNHFHFDLRQRRSGKSYCE
ncbi:MAG: extensin family protein [Pararhizobium sp.]